MSTTTRKANIALWIVQVILAALFLFAGGFKLAASTDALAHVSPFSPLFLKFIGLCEVTGAAGLILPGIFRIHKGLTPLAANGLTIIMIGAVVTTVATIGATAAIAPLIVGILTVTIARGRRQWVRPLRGTGTLPGQLQTARGR